MVDVVDSATYNSGIAAITSQITSLTSKVTAMESTLGSLQSGLNVVTQAINQLKAPVVLQEIALTYKDQSGATQIIKLGVQQP